MYTYVLLKYNKYKYSDAYMTIPITIDKVVRECS